MTLPPTYRPEGDLEIKKPCCGSRYTGQAGGRVTLNTPAYPPEADLKDKAKCLEKNSAIERLSAAKEVVG